MVEPYPSIFNEAMKLVAKHEGGWSNDPTDKGGATNYGISLRFLKNLPKFIGDINNDGVVDIQDIRDMTPEAAKELYHSQFWVPLNVENLRHPWVQIKAFDMAVNMGVKRAATLLQRGFNDASPLFHLKADGAIGPKSIDAMNGINGENLLKRFQERCVGFYEAIVRNDASQSKYIKGWKNRVFNFS